MKNKPYLLGSLVVICLSTITLTSAGGNPQQEGAFFAALIGLCLGTLMLVYWNTVSYKWVCSKCGENFRITLWQNLTGINALTRKRLHCPQCKQKTWCKSEPL